MGGRRRWAGCRDLGAGLTHGRSQVSQGGGARELGGLRTAAGGEWGGSGLAGRPVSLALATCAAARTAPEEVAHLGSSPCIQGDLCQVASARSLSFPICTVQAGEISGLSSSSGNGRTPCFRVLFSRAVWAPAFVSFSPSLSLLGVMQHPGSPMGTSPSSKPPPAPATPAARPRSLSVNGRGRLRRQQDRLCRPAPQFPAGGAASGAQGAAVKGLCAG